MIVPENVLIRLTRQSLFEMPKGWSGAPDGFKDKCLFGCIVYGYYKVCADRNKIASNEYKEEAKMFSKIEKMSSRKYSALKFFDILCNVSAAADIPLEGPHECQRLTSVLSRHFSCQITTYSSLGNKILSMFPPKYDNKWSQVQIYLQKQFNDPDNIHHAFLIKNPTSLFEATSYDCPACSKRMPKYKRPHMCREEGNVACFACRRTRRKENTFITESNKGQYCDSTISPQPEREKCPECHLFFYSEDCKKHHGKDSCGRGFFCQTCKRYVWRTGSLKTLDEIKELHKCGEMTCPKCYRLINEASLAEHQCPLNRGKYQKYWANLLVYDLESIEESVNSCLQCCEKERSFIGANDLFGKKDLLKMEEDDDFDFAQIRCRRHSSWKRDAIAHKPNFCVAAYESKSRGNFHQVCFADPEMHHEDDLKVERNIFYHNYVPNDMDYSRLCTRKISRFARNGKEKSKQYGKDEELSLIHI